MSSEMSEDGTTETMSDDDDHQRSINSMASSLNRCLFHQRFSRAFFVRTSFRQIFYSYIWLGAKISYKKRARLTLMKLTAGVYFTHYRIYMVYFM